MSDDELQDRIDAQTHRAWEALFDVLSEDETWVLPADESCAASKAVPGVLFPPQKVDPPPQPRYRLELTIFGNTHDEILEELLTMTRGGYQLDSEHFTRDEWYVVGGRSTRQMEHVNPGMTPERYEAELDVWWKGKADR